MKRLALLASAIIIGTTGAASADTVSERVVYTTPEISPLQAFDRMDLDNNWVVDTIEYDWAYDHYPSVRGYSFSGMDINGNGKITRSEAKKVSPQAASAQKSVVNTVVKDPVIVERKVQMDPDMKMHHDGDVHVKTNTSTTRTTTTY